MAAAKDQRLDEARLLERRTELYVGPESRCPIYALADDGGPPEPVTDKERGVVQHGTIGGKGCVARIRRGR